MLRAEGSQCSAGSRSGLCRPPPFVSSPEPTTCGEWKPAYPEFSGLGNSSCHRLLSESRPHSCHSQAILTKKVILGLASLLWSPAPVCPCLTRIEFADWKSLRLGSYIIK